MKNEIMESLPQVMQHYANFNLLLPASTEVQLNPFYKYHVEVVPVDTSDNSGDIFKVGSSKDEKTNQWINYYSLSKPLLNKMAMAAGIQFNPDKTYGERVDRMTYRATAQAAMRKADGSIRTETDQKVICLEDEEIKYRLEAEEKAAKGIFDQKQADAARELFAGESQWVENKWGKKVNAFRIAEKDRDRYIERYVQVCMAQLRKTWAEKAMTGAKLRVIRALLGVKGTYTLQELSKNFAITTVVFSPDYTDPEVRRQMLGQSIGSVGNMFGMQAIPVKTVEFDTEMFDAQGEVLPQEEGLINDEPEYDVGQEFQQPEQPTPAPTPPAPTQPEPAPARQGDFFCDQCGCQISEKVWDFSVKKFGRPLCYKHQQEAKGGR